VDTTSGDPPEQPEVRGLAAADLDGDGAVEVIATTTQTTPTENGGAQVFVWSPDGSRFQPAGGATPAWPRYDALSGAGPSIIALVKDHEKEIGESIAGCFSAHKIRSTIRVLEVDNEGCQINVR
jgi:hypothetical protein